VLKDLIEDLERLLLTPRNHRPPTDENRCIRHCIPPYRIDNPT